jgi:hypothetical protein
MTGLRRRMVGILFVMVAGLGVWGLWGSIRALAAPSALQAPRLQGFSHVFWVVMENRSAADLIHNPDAPFINQLIRDAGVATNYYGITHPSLPNYVAAISGGTWNARGDDPSQVFSEATLAGQLTRHHLSWQAAMENLPAPGYPGYWYPDAIGPSGLSAPTGALYAKKHDPFLLFTGIQDHPGQARHVVPLAVLSRELKSGHVPPFVFITPNLAHDMHGVPGVSESASALTRAGDAFLRQWVRAITTSPAWTGNAVIFITWDESGGGPPAVNGAPGPAAPMGVDAAGDRVPLGGGPVLLLVIRRQYPTPIHVDTWADHYSVLKTIEAGFGLPFLGAAASPAVVPLDAFFRPVTLADRVVRASSAPPLATVAPGETVSLTFTFREPSGRPLRACPTTIGRIDLGEASLSVPGQAVRGPGGATDIATVTNAGGQVTVDVVDPRVGDFGVVTATCHGAELVSGPLTVGSP